MAMGDKSGRRRVFQAYRRLGEGASAENPYPTIVSATRAIEERGHDRQAQLPSDFRPAQRPQPIADLRPATTVDPSLVPDLAIKSHRPRVPEDGYETFYTMDPYGNLTRHNPKSQTDYKDKYGRDVTRVDVSNIDMSGAAATVHTHPKGSHERLPGMGDWMIPVRTNRPLYGVVDGATWRVNPPDASGRITVDVLSGRFGQKELDAAVEQLNRRELPGPAKR
jgi:hypothetical protein